MAIKFNGASDTHWSCVNSRAETIHTVAAALSEERGRHYMIRQMCGHIANHAQAVMEFNCQHLRGYDAAADDNISVMCDRIGLLLRDEALVRGLPEAHIAIMRGGVSAIRSALFARQGQAQREANAARFDVRKERAA